MSSAIVVAIATVVACFTLYSKASDPIYLPQSVAILELFIPAAVSVSGLRNPRIELK
jgi:hypothetical protein